MYTIHALNVNDAYIHGMTLLAANHDLLPSRNGNVLVCPEPVATRYAHPRQRVLFFPPRDANPFFHLFEALWMLSGANDVLVPAYFVPRMAEFSDDGTTFHAAYGHRWRVQLGFDQLDAIVTELTQNPFSRRCVLAVWNGVEDLGWDSKDLPCNTTVVFDRRAGTTLNMTVFNRSNDIILGCYGANAVQYSLLQEYLAGRIGCAVGWYEQVSTNFHAYVTEWDKQWPAIEAVHRVAPNPYLDHVPMGHRILTAPANLVGDPELIDAEIGIVIHQVRKGTFHLVTQEARDGLTSPLLREVAVPMYEAYHLYRNGSAKQAADHLEHAVEEFGSIDWLEAGFSWMVRRAAKRPVASRVESTDDAVVTRQGEQA